MSQATLPSRLAETASGAVQITSRLGALRRAVAIWLWARGLAYLLLLLVAVVAVDLLIDWFFQMDRIQRGGCLILATILLAYFLYRYLLAPLSRSIDDDSLVLRVERHHQDLRQSVICALQFSRMTGFEEIGVSTSMVRATIEHGTTAAEGVDFREVMNDSVLRRNLLLVFAGVAVFAGAFAAPPTRPTMLTWLNRNVLLGDEAWPRKSYLVVQGEFDGRIVIPRGDDWTQVVTVKEGSSEMPTEVYLESRLLDVPFWRSSRTNAMTQLGEAGKSFEWTFSNVLEPFKFRLKSKHATSHWYNEYETTRWYFVELVDRPSVEELTLTLTPPAYTGQAAMKLPMGKGPYVAYEGSRLSVSGRANKTLSSAVLKSGDLSIEMDCSENEFSGAVPVGKLVGGTYSIVLTDDGPSKLKSSRPAKFAIKLKQDRAPVVRAAFKGVSGIILAQAVVPIECKIKDEFAIASARLDYELKAADAPSAPPADGSEPPPPADVESIDFVDLAEQFGKSKIQYTHPFEIGPLKLEVGTRLIFQVKATDTNDISGPKTGESDKQYLRIVTRGELMADLLRREREQGQLFERLLKDQVDMLTDTRAILAAVGEKSTMPDAQRRLLIRVKRRESAVGDRCERIAGQLEKLVAEMRNNRLFVDEAKTTEGKLNKTKGELLNEHVIGPLRYLAGDPVPQATKLLDDARRAASNPGSRDAALAKAVATQRRIVVRMQDILKNMITAEGYSEIVGLLWVILQEQEKVNAATRREKEREIEDIFRGGAGESESKK